MAVIDRTKTVQQLNSKLELPKDRYLLVCLKEELKKSQAGNPMIEQDWELVAPETVEINGKPTIVSGTSFKKYWVLKNANGEGGWDEEATKKSQGKLVAFYESMGHTEDIDDENPVLICKGKYADAICGSSGGTMRQKQTPEEKKAGKPGKEILGGDGKPIQNFQHAIFEILGLAEKPANGAGSF